MDLRNLRSYKDESSLRPSRSRSPYQPSSSFGPSAQQSRRGEPYGAQNAEGLVYNQVRKGSPPKTEGEISQQIEIRHEELKRQIALKEKQLANMTGERDTADRLKQRLGLRTQGTAGGDRNSRGQLDQDSQRGIYPSSVSPHTRPVANLVGLRSTYAHKQGFGDSMNERRDLQANNFDDSQQLNFHPTRLPRDAEPGAGRMSPLRKSKSRSKSKEAAAPNYNYTMNSSIASFANQNQMTMTRANAAYGQQSLDPGISPYQSRQKDSPLRQKSPEYDDESQRGVIRPQLIQNNSTRAFTQAQGTGQAAGSQYPGTQGYGGFTNQMAATVTNPRDQLYRDRIEAMTIDNQSLQRRLNQVSKELERISREKDEINRTLNQTEGEVRHMDNIVNARDDVDEQNQILREEVTRIKETNQRLDKNLKNEEIDTANTGDRIVNTNADRKNLEFDKDNLDRDLRDRTSSLDQLNNERVMINQKLNIANNELEMLTRSETSLKQDNNEWSEQIRRLQDEKSELLRNLENLTIQYDNCVRVITGDRRNMDQSNDWQSKIILAKIIFNNLELCQKARTQNSFTEMVEYSKFDGECHQKLKSFANCIYKIGLYKQGKSLNRWYVNSLRPLQTRGQNRDISMIIDCNKLQAKVFYAWRQYQKDKMDVYHFRTSGIQRIWHMLNRNGKQELKRAVDIWKQKQCFQHHSISKLRAQIKRRNDENLKQAMYIWKQYSMLMNNACRIRILQIEYTQKMFLTQVFHQMRWTLRNEKRKRQRYLNHYLKAWQDQVFYNRHLMQTNMAAISFGNHNSRYLLKSCFDALNHHRERNKYELIHHAVTNEMNVAIADTQAFNLARTEKHRNRGHKKASNIIRETFGKKLYGYFQKWVQVNKTYKDKMQRKVKQRIIHMYLNHMNSYFDNWKKNVHEKIRRHRGAMGDQMQMDNERMQNEALEGEKRLRIHAEQVRTSKRRMVDKTFRKLFYRKVATAMGRWRDICGFHQDKEDRAALVIKRLRKRLIRQAFDMYLAFYREHQQHGKNLNSLEHIKDTLNKRLMRKTFNSMHFYVMRHLRAKRYWNKILFKMDRFMKQRAVKLWSENAHITHAQNLLNKQNGHTNDILDRTAEIGQLHLNELDQQSGLKAHHEWQMKKSRRQIGNYFMRNYSSQTGYMFKRWKQNVKDQVHKETVMKRTIKHWRKSQLEACARVFHKFLKDERAKDHRANIKQTKIEAEEHRLSIVNNQEKQQKARDAHAATTSVHNDDKDELSRKIEHTMVCMQRRNQNFVMVCRMRMLLNCWRKAAAQQKAFLYCIKNVLEKSLYKKGFTYIVEQTRDHHYTMVLHRRMRKFAFKFFHANCSDAFTKWKNHGLKVVENSRLDTHKEHQNKVNEHNDFVDKVSQVNQARCLNFLMGNRKSNIWKAWLNVIKRLKLTKSKAAEFAARQSLLRRKFAIQRWSKRLLATKGSRFGEAILIHKFQSKYHTSAFYAWRNVFLNTKRFIRALSNFERKSRQKDYEHSMKCMRAFAFTKGAVFTNRKGQGTDNIIALITQSYLKRLAQGFHQYKANCYSNDQKNQKLKAAWGKSFGLRLRDAFNWWKKKHELADLKQDMHDAGPVRAEYWRSMREIENLKDFLRSEKYTEGEIETIYEGVCDRNEGLMNKYLCRFNIGQQPTKKMLPIVWQRWREYVGIRKLVRYQLNRMQNSIEPGNVDMQRAFTKWKNAPRQLTKELWRLPVETITQLAIRTTKDLEECGDQIAENSAIQNHLMMQRDEFLNYYIKGQILAMGYLKDRAKFVKMQSCSRWCWANRKMCKLDYDRQIRDAAYLHANLQQQEKSLTEDNTKLEGENKELQQFGQDGSIIKGNHSRMQQECDKIKGRIADTDEDYKELMEKNEELKKLVADAEQKVKDQGHNRGAFTKMATLKGQSTAEGSIKVGDDKDADPETSAEKKQRERFERLAQLNQGAGLR